MFSSGLKENLCDFFALSLNFCSKSGNSLGPYNVDAVVRSLSHVWLFATPWTAAHQASLSFTVSRSLCKLKSIKSVMPSSSVILCRPLLLLPSVFCSIRVFPSESAVCIRWPKYWSFTSASVLPKTIQSWFCLGLTALISLLSKGLSRVFSNTIVWKYPFSGTPPSLWSKFHIHKRLLEKP